VAIHCADESNMHVEHRIGQHNGLRLKDLEDGKATESLATILEQTPHLYIVDQGEDNVTIEDTADMLAHRGVGCKGLVLALDSLQTLHSSEADRSNPRERMDAVTRAIKTITKKTGAAGIVTSEVPRSAYLARRRDDPCADMGVFKESGAIEYAATLALMLRPVRGETDLVYVTVPKNKGGEHDPFWLRRDPEQCLYTEVPRCPVKSSQSFDAAILKALRKENEQGRAVNGNRALADLVPGRDELKMQAIKELISKGEIVNRPDGHRPRYWVKDLAPSSPPSDTP
jgi:hypothetical protein